MVDKAGLDEPSEKIAVVVKVDTRYDKLGRSTITEAVVDAVVLLRASIIAITAITISAVGIVLIVSEIATAS